jgi:hypothetical protein
MYRDAYDIAIRLWEEWINVGVGDWLIAAPFLPNLVVE